MNLRNDRRGIFRQQWLFLLALLISWTSLSAEDGRDATSSSVAVDIDGRSSLLNINNLSMWVGYDGTTERRINPSGPGVIYPRRTVPVVLAGGFLWCGDVRDGTSPVLRSGGQTMRTGTVPGRIIRPGVAENPANPDQRVFRIRRDWATADLRQDASEVFGIAPSLITTEQIQTLRDQYRRDWIEWPWEKGAPYYNRDGIPGYQPHPGGRVDSTTDEPGLGDADQVVWVVANDLDEAVTRRLYGSPPIGLELQVTCWAYSKSVGLRNVVFQRYRIVYKGTATTPSTAFVDSMYLAKWVDPDIGDFADDYVAYSINRNLAIAYNSRPVDSKFSNFNLVPAVLGYDLLQGPRVRRTGGKAHWDLRTIQGYENLPVTAFTYFTDVTRITDRGLESYTTTREWWNIVRGFRPRPLNSPACMVDPTSNRCSQYELWGDPLTLEGWVDGRVDPAGDRRFLLSSGPFTLAFGDTQEVVVALMAATGSDNRDGIRHLVEYDDFAQEKYVFDFGPPAPIPVPGVRVVELDRQLILDWEKDTARIRQIEKFNLNSYTFETYRIYQFPKSTSSIEDAVQLPPFDISQPRFLSLTTDYIRNRPLVNGQRYYYAVTAVMASSDPLVARKRIESPIVMITATPHSPNPGTVYPYEIGEEIPEVTNLVGHNDAAVRISYFDPSQPDARVYKILFRRSLNQQQWLDEKPTWDFIDSTAGGDTLLRRIRVDTPPQRVVTRGMTVQVISPITTMKGVFEVRRNNQPVRNPVFNRPNPGRNYMVVSFGSSQIDSLRGGAFIDIDTELRFTGDSSWCFFRDSRGWRQSRWVRVPFTAWRRYLGRADTTFQQSYTYVIEQGLDSIWRPAAPLDYAMDGELISAFYPISIFTDSLEIPPFGYLGGTYHDDIVTRPERDFLTAHFWIESREGTRSRFVSTYRAYILDLDRDGVPAPIGTSIRFERYKIIQNGDVKIFSPTRVEYANRAAAERTIEKVNVFPNPYYGMNRAEENPHHRFVTFSHLSHFATIRVFNLAGVLVKTVHKESPEQFARWDLNNENGLPVAGGLYVAHLELRSSDGSDLGTKVLKLMVVREAQRFE